MSQVFAAEKVERTKGDPFLMGILLLLLGTGLVLLFSSSFFRAELMGKGPFFFFGNQLLYAIAGVIAALFIARLKTEILNRIVPIMVVVSLLLMVLTFFQGIGASYLGARRWIVIFNTSFQPSELVKVTLVLYLARVLSRKQSLAEEPVKTLIPPFVIVGIFSFLVYLQNNFSTAVFLMCVSLAMFFMAGVRFRFFLLLGLILVPLVIGAVFAKEHRMERISVFMEPERDPSGSGYQVLASQTALRDGGFWGKGIGMGERKLGKLPEAQSDFIFAVVGEEMGFLGVVGVIGLFGLFAWRSFAIALQTEDLFKRLMAFGATTSIVLQALINIAVTAGMLPPTGIPLPFFSSGGSSLLLTLCMCGLLLNVARQPASSPGGALHG